MTAELGTPWDAHLQTLRRAEADLSAEEQVRALIQVAMFTIEELADVCEDVDQIIDEDLPAIERRITARRGSQYGSPVKDYPMVQVEQLSAEIREELADMDLLPRVGDPRWDENWAEYVAYLGGVPQAVEACRRKQLVGQRNLRGHVVDAVGSFRRRAKKSATQESSGE